MSSHIGQMDLNNHPADRATATVVGQSWDIKGPRTVPKHKHRRGQLIYTESGCVTVEVADARFIAPPQRAVWLPPGTSHTAFYPRDVAFRGLFFEPQVCRSLPSSASVLQIDPLSRELIRAAVTVPWEYPKDGPEARLIRVLLDRITVLPSTQLWLSKGQDKAVIRVMEALVENPADGRSIREWAAHAHLSERTLARRFISDTGSSLTAWRNQLRLITAIERLALGQSVTSVALDLGYASPSSFATMFKRSMGMAPKDCFS